MLVVNVVLVELIIVNTVVILILVIIVHKDTLLMVVVNVNSVRCKVVLSVIMMLIRAIGVNMDFLWILHKVNVYNVIHLVIIVQKLLIIAYSAFQVIFTQVGIQHNLMLFNVYQIVQKVNLVNEIYGQKLMEIHEEDGAKIVCLDA